MDNPILMLHRQSDICWLCEQHFKSKGKFSAMTSVNFTTFKEYARNWTTVEKGPSNFQDFHLTLGKCNAVTAESLKNETLKCHPQCRPDFTNDTTLNRILQQQTKEKEEHLPEVTKEQQEEETFKKVCAVSRTKFRNKKSTLLVTRKPHEKDI